MLNSLYIKNFRQFKELKIEHLGQVNLLVGKNNSGKTCLLEALWIYASHAAPSVLRMIISEREEYWEHSASWKHDSPPIPPHKHPIRYLFHGYQWTEEDIEIGLLEPAQERIILNNESLNWQEPFPNFKCQFLSTRPIDTKTIADLWDSVLLTPLEELIIKAVRLVDSKIQKIAVTRSSEIPIVVYEDERLPLKNLGDGISRVFHIILSLVNARDGFLLIDEFENGLHWKVQPKLWEMIFNLAEKLNVQVFATTHSQDCVQGFHTVWDTQEDKGSFHRLHHRSDFGTVATPYRCETLANALEMDVEMR